MGRDQEVIDKIRDLIIEAYNPRAARIKINEIFPDYNDKDKLENIVPKVMKSFDIDKRKALKKTQYFKYFLIGEDTLKAF
ncbi:MAG: hypothetical protein GF329_22530 [Candidatus Lokiarchaeota archaeon]|nr:hypothetical protein [Candidatus Lokiarchaeota archaeon]